MRDPTARLSGTLRRTGRMLAWALCCLLGPSPSAAQQVITTVAGGGPDGLPGVSANLASPAAVLAAPSGDLYIGTSDRVFRLDAVGTLSVVAGRARSFCFGLPLPSLGDGGAARSACLGSVRGLARDAAGALYIADAGNDVVMKVDPATGIISRAAGSYTPGFGGDGLPATDGAVRLDGPRAIALDAAGNLFIADRNNHRVRRVSAATGIITTVAGSGVATGSIDGEGGLPQDDLGDGGPAASATLVSPSGLALDASGNLFIGDMGGNRVRRIDAATGVITTVAGDGMQGYATDSVPATSTSLIGPAHLAFDAAGNLYLAESNDLVSVPAEEALNNHRIRRVDRLTGIIETVAGTGAPGFQGDGGPATAARLSLPTGVAADPAGNLFIADLDNHRVRKVDAGGDIATVAGNGAPTFSGDGFPAARASLSIPLGLTFDGNGALLVSDTGNGRIRRLDPAGAIVTTLAGTGFATGAIDGPGGDPADDLGDGGPASAATFCDPSGLAKDAAGNIYVVDRCNQRIRKIAAATGVITTIAGVGFAGQMGDGGQATSAALNFPEAVALNAAGDVYIADAENNRIRRIRSSTGVITTVAGNGIATGDIDGPGGDPADDLGDGGPATAATLSFPTGVALSAAGDIFISDHSNNRVRLLSISTGVISTFAGTGSTANSGDGGPATAAPVGRPGPLALDAEGNLFVQAGQRVRRVDAATGIITAVAGTNARGHTPDGGPAGGSLDGPWSLLPDSAGNLLVAESLAQRVRLVLADPPGAGVVSGGDAPGETQLSVTLLPDGRLALSWGASCVATDFDYAVYQGTLGDFASHAPLACSTSGGTGLTFTPGPGDHYYLIVPRNEAREGSYGPRSDGSERPASALACVPREIASACP